MKTLRPTLRRPNLQRENELASGFRRIAGVDEAGRGPLAGPVVAAAVLLPAAFETRFPTLSARLDDSKKLSADARHEIFEELTGFVEYGIGLIDAPTIDAINIRQASWRAMQEAIADLESRSCAAFKQLSVGCEKHEDAPRMSTHAPNESVVAPETDAIEAVTLEWKVDYVLIDGLPYGEGPWPYEAIVKGDSRSLSIAAASILAKVSRDRLMREMDALYPHYGFAQHKGYGTEQHLRALSEHGPCAIHRLSFAPVKRVAHLKNCDASA